MSRWISLCALSTSLLLIGCVVHHRRHRAAPPPESRVKHHRQPAPAPEPEPKVTQPPVHSAPPASRAPQFQVIVDPPAARPGDEVQLRVDPAPGEPVMIYYNGRPMPKKELGGGLFVVTVPADAADGRFEIELDGRRYRSNRLQVTR
jgi:hypothetical protein